MRTVIKIERVGKQYALASAPPASTFREALCGLWNFRRRREERFWALRNFSLNVHRGDRIGIIGGNGSGKSTLLKILSRITPATEGRVRLLGRVSSMLEVGTGFHPELSGRENVFLNGAVLGMSRAEIRSRFDEIVSFSGVEKFIDMPVKRYSSGMYVRLAFAVAAHLESELLLLDEVLAVGDAEFQARCLDKMRSITSDEGRTIIFVSHNMMAVRSLCNRAVVLKNGERISDDEDVGNCVNLYLRERQPGGERVLEWVRSDGSFSHSCFSPVRLALSMADGSPVSGALSTDGAYRVDFYFDAKRVHPGLYFDFLVSAGGVPLFSAAPWENRDAEYHVHAGENRVSWFIPPNLLNFGNYRITLRAAASGGGGFRMPTVSAPELHLPVSVCGYPLARPSLYDRRLLHPELHWELE